MNSKYQQQQLIGMDDVNDENNNNNNNVTCYNLNLSATPSPQRKKRPLIHLDAQLVGDDLFRMLVAGENVTDHMFNRSK